jgi:hypothetical protein
MCVKKVPACCSARHDPADTVTVPWSGGEVPDDGSAGGAGGVEQRVAGRQQRFRPGAVGAVIDGGAGLDDPVVAGVAIARSSRRVLVVQSGSVSSGGRPVPSELQEHAEAVADGADLGDQPIGQGEDPDLFHPLGSSATVDPASFRGRNGPP